MNVKEKIIEASKILDEIDVFGESVPSIQQEYDYKLSDLYHKLESMSLDSKKCYRFCKELKSVLKERREFKDNVELFKIYQKQTQKLINGKENRQMLLSDIGKREKCLHFPYQNRIYKEEELAELIGK